MEAPTLRRRTSEPALETQQQTERAASTTEEEERARRFQARVRAFYWAHDPRKVESVEELLEAHQGKEEALLQALHRDAGVRDFGGDEAVDDLYEHERYSYLTFSWGSLFPGHLLPTDRGRWSNRHGAPSSQTREKVEPQLPIDWTWTSEWRVDMDSCACDEDGWVYAFDFNMINHMIEKKRERKQPRSTDYVRRRRWVRTRRRVSMAREAAKHAPGMESEESNTTDSSSSARVSFDGEDQSEIFRRDEAVGVLRPSYQDSGTVEPSDEPEAVQSGKEASNSPSMDRSTPVKARSDLPSPRLEIFTKTMEKVEVDAAWSAATAALESSHHGAKSRETQRFKKWKVKKEKIRHQIGLLEKTIASMEAVAEDAQQRRRSSASARSSPQKRASLLKSSFSNYSIKAPLSPDSKEFASHPRSDSGLSGLGGAASLASKLRRAQAKLDALKRLYWHPREKDYTLRFSVDGIFYGLRDFSVESFSSSFSVQMSHQTNGAHGITPTCKVTMAGHTVCCGKHVKVVGEKGTRVPKSIWDAMYLDTDFEVTLLLIFVEDPEEPGAVHRGNWEFLLMPEATKVELSNFSRRVKGGMDLPEPIVRKLCSDVMSSLVRDLALLYFPVELAILFDAPPSRLDVQGEVEIRGPRIDDVMEKPIEEIDVVKETRQPDASESVGLLEAATAQLRSLVLSEKSMKEIARLLELSFGQFNLLVALKDSVDLPSGHSLDTVASICEYYKAFLSTESGVNSLAQVQHLRQTWKRLAELRFVRKQHRMASACAPRTQPTDGGGSSRCLEPVPAQFELLDMDALFDTIGRLVRKPASLEVRVSRFNCTLKAASAVEAVAKAYERVVLGLDLRKPRSGYDAFLYGFRFGRKASAGTGDSRSGASAASPPSRRGSPQRAPSGIEPLVLLQADAGFRARFKTFSAIVRALKDGVELVKRNMDELSAEVAGSLKGTGDDCQVSGSFRDMDFVGPVSVSLALPPLFLGLYRAELVALGNDMVGLQLDLMLPAVDAGHRPREQRSRLQTLVPFGRVMISEMHTEVLVDVDALVAQYHAPSLSSVKEKVPRRPGFGSFSRRSGADKALSTHAAFSMSFSANADATANADSTHPCASSAAKDRSSLERKAPSSTAFGRLKLSSSEFTKLHANAKTGSFKTRLLGVAQQLLSALVHPSVAAAFPQHQALFDSLQASLLRCLCSPTIEAEFELLTKAFVLDKDGLVLMVCGAPTHPTPMAFREELPLLDAVLRLDDLVSMWIDDRYPPYANPMYF